MTKPAKRAAPARARARTPKPRRPGPDVSELLRRLDRDYGASRCSLDYRNPFELVVATALSAQCTDLRVNLVTKDLFREAPDPAALDRLPLERVEALVKSTGFFRNKAKNLKGLARTLLRDFGGQVPRTMEGLLTLPGVARKTANVTLGNAFGIASGVVVDTHVGRIVRRLGITAEEDPVKVERALNSLLPEEHWIRFSHQLIDHGRAVCTALRPKCGECRLCDLCAFAKAAASG